MAYSDAAFIVCLAAGALALFHHLWTTARKTRFEQLIRPFDQAEEDARRRGDTRAIGKARRARREAVHASLRRAA